MFCSACGAKVRDTDSFCWKCGAKVGAPHIVEPDVAKTGLADSQQTTDHNTSVSAESTADEQPAKPTAEPYEVKVNAKVAFADVPEKSSEVSRKAIVVGEDGTIHVKSRKIAAKNVGAPAPVPQATCIDPSSYAGTWFDIHQAVLATGSTFHEMSFQNGNGTVHYRLNRELLPFVPDDDPIENCLIIDVAGAGIVPVNAPEDIPKDLKVDWIELFLSSVDTNVDTSSLVWMVRLVAGYVGFTPVEIQEEEEGNHELTDAVATAFGISGKTASGKEAARYYDGCQDEGKGAGLKIRLFGYIGYPDMIYEAEMRIISWGGIVLYGRDMSVTML